MDDFTLFIIGVAGGAAAALGGLYLSYKIWLRRNG